MYVCSNNNQRNEVIIKEEGIGRVGEKLAGTGWRKERLQGKVIWFYFNLKNVQHFYSVKNDLYIVFLINK